MNINEIASKEIFKSSDIKGVWIVSGFSDENDKDWYNLYDYNNLQLTGEYLELEETVKHSKKVRAFDNDDWEYQNMMTLEELFEFLQKFNFKRI
jgi:hypothetical protein